VQRRWLRRTSRRRALFSLLQKNVFRRQRWATRDQLRLAIVLRIEKTYHRRRRQDALGRMTPIDF
jgi:putative transposase